MAKADILQEITSNIRNKTPENKIVYTDLAKILEDTVNEIPEAGSSNPTNPSGSGLGTIETLNTTIDATNLNFGGSNPNSIELIPAQAGKMIVVHSYAIIADITSTLQQSYSQVYLGYNLQASGYPEDITTIPVDNATRSFKISTGVNVDNNQFNNDDESILNAAIYLRGEDGVGYSGIAGTVNIQMSYSYIDFPLAPSSIVIGGGSTGDS